jgi:hypothetical protein
MQYREMRRRSDRRRVRVQPHGEAGVKKHPRRAQAGRAWLALGAILLVAPWLMGLGGGNGGSEKAIPIPQKNFTVTVSDTKGQKATAERFTWEGKVNFQGQYGSATITLPFQKVQAVKVLPSQGGGSPTTVLTRMTLRSGETLELSLDRASKCYGETAFGNYEIFLKDVTEITFQ